jgi:hypothetical protein
VLYGNAVDVDERGEEISGDTLMVLFSADHANTIEYTLPRLDEHHAWEVLVDTREAITKPSDLLPGAKYQLAPCCMAVLRLVSTELDETIQPNPTPLATGSGSGNRPKSR